MLHRENSLMVKSISGKQFLPKSFEVSISKSYQDKYLVIRGYNRSGVIY